MAGGGTTTMPLGGTPLSLQRWQGVALAIRQGGGSGTQNKKGTGYHYKYGTGYHYQLLQRWH